MNTKKKPLLPPPLPGWLPDRRADRQLARRIKALEGVLALRTRPVAHEQRMDIYRCFIAAMGAGQCNEEGSASIAQSPVAEPPATNT